MGIWITTMCNSSMIFTFPSAIFRLYDMTNIPMYCRRDLRMHFLENNICNLIQIFLSFVPKGPPRHMPALFGIMVSHRTADNPSYEAMMTSFTDADLRHQDSIIFKSRHASLIMNFYVTCCYLISSAIFNYVVRQTRRLKNIDPQITFMKTCNFIY